MENKNISMTLEIKYDKLYFDDIVFIFKSLKNRNKIFFTTDKYWVNEDIYKCLKNNNIKIEKEQYDKIIPALKDIIKRSIDFQIENISKGSLIIKISLDVLRTTLVPLISISNLPQGIEIGMILVIINNIYSKYEKEYDNMILEFERNCIKRLSKKKERNIDVKVKK